MRDKKRTAATRRRDTGWRKLAETGRETDGCGGGGEREKKEAVECRDGESVLIKTLNLTRRRRADDSEINPLIASRRRRQRRSSTSRRRREKHELDCELAT